jgi:aminopeptidase-like protein
MNLKPILEKIFPLHRTLASDGTDDALGIVGAYLPDAAGYSLETYAPGTPVWTWQVPERYVVHEAFLETESGEAIVDFHENPLHLVSYSLPVDQVMGWEELEPHLYVSERFPEATPWVFKFYERDWGFCLPKALYDRLERNVRYRAVIRSEFVSDPEQGFRIGVGRLDPSGGQAPDAGEMIIAAHVCHPMQANDDAAGVVSALGLAERLAANPLPPGSMSVRFLFCPETIGTIAYLAHNENLFPQLKGGIFLEMTGNQNPIAWHHSRQHDHLLDRVTRAVLERRGEPFEERPFAAAPANDERVINGPGVNVPCISLNRWPYEEYHTTEDNPGIIHEAMLQEAAEIAEEVIRIFASNYIPRRTFKGPVFLSGHGLWVDWRENWDLNRAIEKIMMLFEGEHSVFDIAQEVGLDYWVVRDYVERFRARGFVEALPIPSEAPQAE